MNNLWAEILDCLNDMDAVLETCRESGVEWVEADADYYTIQAEETMLLKRMGYSQGLIDSVVKGQPKVNEAYRRKGRALVEYDNAKEARNVIKKKLQVLADEYQREWNSAKE